MIGKTLIIIESLHSTHTFKWLQTSIQTTTIYSYIYMSGGQILAILIQCQIFLRKFFLFPTDFIFPGLQSWDDTELFTSLFTKYLEIHYNMPFN